jgi:uncharacterized protein YdaU (DUF1376 family)
MNHYPRHIGDYLRDTGHLSLLEHGVYGRLLDLYYLNNGPIPGDIAGLCRKLGARSVDEKAAVEAVATEFFGRSETGDLTNKRADAELAKYQKFGEVQRERVMKRYAKSTGGIPAVAENLPAVALDLPAAYQPPGIPTINQEPVTKNQEPKNPPTPRKRGKPADADVDWFAGLPGELDVPEFREAWLDWVEYRKRRKLPLNPISLPRTWSRALRNGVKKTIEDIDRAIVNGWQGHDHDNKAAKPNDHRSEKRSREFVETIVVPDFE